MDDQPTQIERRVIQVSPDQVIGRPRKHKRKRPRRVSMFGDSINVGSWCPPTISPTWGEPDNAPTQQGFKHFDQIAKELKARLAKRPPP